MTSTESSKENRGVFQGHDNNWDQEEFEGAEEEDGDNDGWGSGGVHYSEYLAAAAAATKAAARSSANVSFSDAMSSHTHTEDVQEESKGNQDDEPTASSIEGSAPFTPPATPAASPAIPVSNGEGIHAESGDVACPSVRFTLVFVLALALQAFYLYEQWTQLLHAHACQVFGCFTVTGAVRAPALVIAAAHATDPGADPRSHCHSEPRLRRHFFFVVHPLSTLCPQKCYCTAA